MGSELGSPRGEDVREQLGRILESPVFEAAPQISRLLSFLVEAALGDEPLKESVIGVSFFNRASGYDPQRDPVVRTEVRRLRLKLGEYYVRDGAAAPVLIEIPQGGYRARFSFREAPSPEAPAESIPKLPTAVSASAVGPKWYTSRRTIGLTASALFFVIAAFWVLRPVVHTMGRKTVTVLKFRELDSASDAAWLASALSEVIGTRLSGSDKLRRLPLDDASRRRVSLAQPDPVLLSPADLTQLRQALGVDVVISGSYSALASGESRRYRVDAQLYDTHAGRVIGAVAETGDEQSLYAMVSRVATRIGRQLGAEPLSQSAELHDTTSSAIDFAKTLSMKAQSIPAGPDQEALYRQALEIGRRNGSGTWEIIPLNGLAKISASRKDFENSANYFRQSYELSAASNGPDNPATVEAEIGWARARVRLKQEKEAVVKIRQAVSRAQRSLAGDPDRLWNVLHDAIHGCNEAKAFGDAESYTRSALALNEQMHLPVTSERWGMLYWDLGRAKRGEKQYAEAVSAFEKAKSSFQFPDGRIDQVDRDIEITKAAQLGKS